MNRTKSTSSPQVPKKDADGRDLLAGPEKILESEPVKTWETLRKLGGLIWSFVNFIIGIWYYLTKPQPEHSPVMLTVKATIFSISVCGALGIGLCSVFLIRHILRRKKGGLIWWDWILGVPIGAYLAFYLWYYRSSPYLMIFSWTGGFLFFLMLVVFPELHKHKIID